MLEHFQTYRPLLFSLAYRMLGSAVDAEDIVQDAYLRIHDQPEEAVTHPRAYLTTIVTRLCLNRLSSAQATREQYLGTWLPEPVFSANPSTRTNPMDHALSADSLSIAFLVLLESLSPSERAVLILHDVFDYRHREVAEIVGKSETAVRQLYRRAKQHVTANRPRFEATAEQHARLLNSFVDVVQSGKVDAFLELLAEDVALVPDGGGTRGAATRVIVGRASVEAFIHGVRRIAPSDLRYEVVTLNGQPALLGRSADGRPFVAVFALLDGPAVRMLHVIGGEKLRGLAAHLEAR